jgi:hypothetical protein
MDELHRNQQSGIFCYYWANTAMRSRSVSDLVLSDVIEVPTPTASVVADWERDMSLRLEIVPGDVEELSLARTRMRWSGYKSCVAAAHSWTRSLGLDGILESCPVSLMACRGARYHHDGEMYGGKAFCNVFLSEDKGLDLLFPAIGHRIPLVRGTAVIFDTCQPHAVIDRRKDGFDAADFPLDRDCGQVFLTWELPIENANVCQALGIALDADVANALLATEAQVRKDGVRVGVSQDTGALTPL